MSPLRRRKRGKEWDLRARARRVRLAERERLAYERERGEQPPEEAAEAPPPRRERPRRRRRQIRRPSFSGLRTASASGARATARQTAPGLRRVFGSAGRGLGRLLALLLRLADLVERAITALFDGLVELGERALEFAEHQLTPERVLVGVIGAAAACLGVSQFVAYRGVEVGQPQYSAVSAIAPPPQTDRVDAGAAHAYVLLPLAVLAVVAAALALATGRWRLARVVSVIGLLGIAVSLAIDLPTGLDAGTAGSAFAGANATMTEGFYAQLAASASLVLCGWVLSVSLRQRAGVARRPGRVRGSGPRLRRAPSVAGGGA